MNFYVLRSPFPPYFVYYVGMTKGSLEKRYLQHLRSPWHTKNCRLVAAWIKQLHDLGHKPTMERLRGGPSHGRYEDVEAYWIAHFWRSGHPLLNTQRMPPEAGGRWRLRQ